MNRIANTRKSINAIRQMGDFNSFTAYIKEFSKWLLQVPIMAVGEQIFHYSHGIKNIIRVEIERSEVATLPHTMKTPDSMDSLCNNLRGAFIFLFGYDRCCPSRYWNCFNGDRTDFFFTLMDKKRKSPMQHREGH